MSKQENEVLLHALSERYSSIHIIRERVHSTSIWLLWILLWLSWATINLDFTFSCLEKIIFLIIVISSWFCIVYFYYFDLEKWFTIQRDIASKIEDKLWFYNWHDSIYPKAWKDCSKWNFFRNNYILIWFWFLVFIVSIIYFL